MSYHDLDYIEYQLTFMTGGAGDGGGGVPALAGWPPGERQPLEATFLHL